MLTLAEFFNLRPLELLVILYLLLSINKFLDLYSSYSMDEPKETNFVSLAPSKNTGPN